MADVRDLTVRIKGDTTNFEKSMQGVKSSSDSAGMSFGKMAGAVAAGQAIFNLAQKGINELTGFLKTSVDAYKESETAVTQLNAVLASTKGAAGITADAAINLSKALQRSTAYSDEQALSVENMALTFTSIGKNIFPEATKAAMDMAVALNHGLTPTGDEATQKMVLLGKALQDPDAGLGALKKVGVNVDELKKKFVGITDVTVKQKLILKELNTEYGGSAAAATDTYAGSIQMLKNSFNDIQETIGKVILDGLNPFISTAARFANTINWTAIIDKSVVSLKIFWGELVNVYEKMKKVYDTVENYLEPKFIALWHTIEQKLLPILVQLWHNVIEPLIPVIGTIFVGAIGVAIDVINGLATATAAVVNWFEKHRMAALTLAIAIGSLATVLGLSALFSAISAGFAVLTTVTIPAFIGTLSMVGTAFLAAFPYAVVIAGIVAVGLEIKKAYDDLMRLNDAATKATTNLNKQLDDQVSKGKLTLDQAYSLQQSAGYKGANQIYKQGNIFTGGYASGGFTGRGGENEVAGVVHKGEYVLPQSMVDQTTGKPKDLAQPVSQNNTSVNLEVNIGMYAGMPVEKREIALELWKEIVRGARAQGVQLPMIGAVGVQ
jgi:hypothetical protein